MRGSEPYNFMAKKPSISVVSVFTFTNELAVLIFIERVLHIYGSKNKSRRRRRRNFNVLNFCFMEILSPTTTFLNTYNFLNDCTIMPRAPPFLD